MDEDPAWQVVKEAAHGLAAQHAKADRRFVVLLQHEQAGVRAAAALAIGAGGNFSFRAHLEPLLGDPSDLVRSAARDARALLID